MINFKQPHEILNQFKQYENPYDFSNEKIMVRFDDAIKAMVEYSDQFKQLDKPVVMQGPLLWNTYPSVRPTEYGDYFVYRAGKIHKETWNNTGWAYNNNTVTHWLEISGPTVGKERGQGNKSDGFCYNWIGLNNVRCKEQCERCKPNGDLRGGSADGLPY